MSPPFDPAPVLASLKDFQRRTVEYVFHRLYVASSSTRRFLVADEVGLGKTLVAKGVIAKAIQYLQPTTRRIDIIYVCSNADIAGQNIGRLNVTGQHTFERATRLTLLPQELHDLDPDPQQARINFVSFTPGTTFDMGKRGGTKEERRLMCQMLAQGREGRFVAGLQRLSRATAGEVGWQDYVVQPVDFDAKLARDFRGAVAGDGQLTRRLSELAEYFYDRRHVPDATMRDRALQLISDLRGRLAEVCLAALEPDLVILDEFQRFRDLLNPENPSAELAQTLFKQPGVRVLLLSATPYKMYARDDEGEDHFADFLKTIKFLVDADAVTLAELQRSLEITRDDLLLRADGSDVSRGLVAKRRVQSLLLSVMCRTERVGATRGGDAMVQEVLSRPELQAADLDDLAFAEAVARAVKAPGALDYWKSSPYLFNFMGGYELKRRFVDGLHQDADRGFALSRLGIARPPRLLPKRAIGRFAKLEPANGRTRVLLDEMLDKQLWRLLWLPPSLLYWLPAGSFEGVTGVTKFLVFSAWNVVPDALSAVLSYEAERRMMGDRAGIRYREIDRYAGRLRGLNAFATLCPSPALAELVDPLALARMAGIDGKTDLASVVHLATQLLRPYIEPLVRAAPAVGLPDPRWYWVVIARLTMQRFPSTKAWGAQAVWHDEAAPTASTGGDVGRFVAAFDPMPDSPLGRIPRDLYEVVAQIALGGPGVCALRSLRRVAPNLRWDDRALVAAAWKVGDGFRSLFNRPEVVVMLQRDESESDGYWKRSLSYALDGNVASLLDEQVHLLVESLGLTSAAATTRIQGVADEIHTAMSIHTASLRPDDIRCAPDGFSVNGQISMRCRYAVRFGDQDEQDKAVSRKEAIRIAFNSPFRPFVLATTSVGQEGLDFHQWCHAVVHWNLPSNPVDLEQREGRVHRYKGHAVRKNVAKAWGRRALQDASVDDVWSWMFAAAVAARPPGDTDLVPYWVYDVEGGAKVERRFLVTPLSSEAARCVSLKRGLALYRLVFGQPRQEDLLAYLAGTVDVGQIREVTECCRIDLEPPPFQSDGGTHEEKSDSTQTSVARAGCATDGGDCALEGAIASQK